MYQPNIYGNGTDLNCEQAYVGGWSRGPRKSSAEIIRVNAAPDTGYCTESFFGAHSWQRRNGTGPSRICGVHTLPSLDSHPVVGLNSSEQKTCKRLAIARSKRRIQHLDCVPCGHCTSISSCSEWSLKQRSDLFALRNPIEAKHIKEWKLLQLEWNLIATLKRNFHIPPHGMGVV